MKKLVYLSSTLLFLSCGSQVDDSVEVAEEPNENVEAEIELTEKTEDASFIESILGEYVEVSFEVEGEDTIFYLCEDGIVTQLYMRDPDDESKFISQYMGLQDAWSGRLVSATETDGGFIMEEACMEYPDCDVTITRWNHYGDGFMTDKGNYYILKEKSDKYSKKHCGLFDEDEFF